MAGPADRLRGKTVLITGAAGGQGAAEARRCATEGGRVVVADVRDREGERVAESICAAGGSAHYAHLDVTELDDWRRVCELIEGLGGLDVLVNNAGVAQSGPHLLGLDLEEWHRVLNTNLTGPFLGIRECAPLMRAHGGSIINVGSAAAVTGNPIAAYTASKWALRGLTKSAAFELAKWNIRVNAVHPGIVLTDMVSGRPAGVEAMRRLTPLARVASAEEVAAFVAFLASEDASYLTGLDLPFDGGFASLGPFWSMFEEGFGRGGA